MNNSEKTLIKITFRYKGYNLNFDDITEKMKLTPNNTRKESDFPKVSQKAGVARDIWEISSGYNESRVVAEEFEKFLIKLSDKIEIINKLKNNYNMISLLTISIKAHLERRPYIFISHKCIEFLYNSNTDIDIDEYYD